MGCSILPSNWQSISHSLLLMRTSSLPYSARPLAVRLTLKEKERRLAVSRRMAKLEQDSRKHAVTMVSRTFHDLSYF